MNSSRPVCLPSPYTDEQIIEYLVKIKYFESSDQLELPSPNYETLAKIIHQHYLTIPFGALSLLYYKKLSTPLAEPIDPLDPYTTRGMRLDPESVFNKLVRRNREGYCLEQNSLLRNVLAHLGFLCYQTCGRMVDYESSKNLNKVIMEGLSHWMVIVELDGVDYLADVGFGAPGPDIPLRLDQSFSKPNQVYRIKKTNYNQSDMDHSYFVEWGMKVSSDGDVTDWQPLYSFQPIPFTDSDRDVVHMYTSHAKNELFQQHIHLAIYTESGSITLRDKTLTVRSKGQPRKDRDVLTESERREVYKSVFNIDLDPEDEEYLPLSFGEGFDPLP